VCKSAHRRREDCSVEAVHHQTTIMSSTQTIPATMKAAYIDDFKKPVQLDMKRKVPSDVKDYDILVQVKAASYCHTDKQVWEGVYESQGSFKGMIGCHEPAGVVVQLGSKAESDGRIKLGDRITSINTYGYCGECQACKHQGRQLCEKLPGLLGLTKDGE
jgi:propanol-preferring alcohol dehydrogenase